jgi:excisionase family DNA binding protein
MERLMLRPREAAESIGIGRTQLYRLVKAGIIPSCRVGSSIRIPVLALRAWADNQANADGENPTVQRMPPEKSQRTTGAIAKGEFR